MKESSTTHAHARRNRIQGQSNTHCLPHSDECHARIQRGWGRRSGPPPRKNHINIEFPNSTGPDPLKITKLLIQHSMSRHHQPASETPFKWRFAGGPLMSCLYWYLDPSSPNQTIKKRCQSWTPSNKKFWIRACTV